MGENEFVNSDTYKEYEWKGMPLTFSSNSIGSEPEFISDLPEKSLIGTHIYVLSGGKMKVNITFINMNGTMKNYFKMKSISKFK